MKLSIFFITLFLSMYTLTRAQDDLKESPRLMEVAQFDHYQPIGVTITKGGRIFVTFPYRQPYEFGLAEIVDGQRRPYPDAEWNRHDSMQAANHFINVQAVWADDNNKLWVLDPANPDDLEAKPEGVKLLRIDLATNKLEQIYRFEDLPRERTALNDVRIDTRRGLAYISEPKMAALIVLNLKTGKSRIVLKDDKSVKADPDFKLNLDGKEVVDDKGKPFSSNVNGIALTHDFRYFYYRAINQTKLYRMATEYLADESLTDAQLSTHVEVVGETGVSHGMIADAKGNVYTTDSPSKALRYVTPDGRFETLVRDKRLIWPDSYSVGTDGYLYLTCSQINRTKKYNKGEDKVEYPFRLYKIKLP